MAQSKLSKEIVDAAIEGFEAQKRRIDSQIAELRALVSNTAATASSPTPRKRGRRGKMSAAGRAAIAEAQRKRWAAKKAGSPSSKAASPSASTKPPAKKRRLSAAGRKAIAEAQKKRWAMKKAPPKAA
jgi:peptidoglycan hydrolase CwlO-like protein